MRIRIFAQDITPSQQMLEKNVPGGLIRSMQAPRWLSGSVEAVPKQVLSRGLGSEPEEFFGRPGRETRA
jgi:hypothetical protein